MSLSNLTFVTLSLFIFSVSFAQPPIFQEYNLIGVSGGVSLYDISTSDLNTKQGVGFAGELTTRGTFYNEFDLIWGVGFLNNNLEILGRNLEDTGQQYIDYTIQNFQLKLLGSWNIVRHTLTLEFGPVLNVNGKMSLDNDNFEDSILDGYTELTAGDIEDISRVNFHLQAGISSGIKRARLSAQYQYGVTNTLGNLNDKNLENSDFKGNSSTILLTGTFYF